MSDDEQQIDDLFGSDDDDQEEDFGRAKLNKRQRGDSPDAADEQLEDEDDFPASKRRAAVSDEEGDGDEEEEQQPVRERERGRGAPKASGPAMTIDAPLLAKPAADKLHYLKLSNIIGLDPRPFDPDTYQEEDELVVEEGGKRKVMLRDQAVIRWRSRAAPGREVRESNARFVRWSDGSLQMLLGDEVLDVVINDNSSKHAYLFAVMGVIQGQAALTTKMAFQPASLDSKLHKRLRDQVDKRHVKTTKVRGTVGPLTDPIKEQERRAREAEDILRTKEQLQRKQDKSMASYNQPRGRQQLNTRFLEEDDGFDVENDDFIDDDDNDGMTATERARAMTQHRRRNFDEDEEEAAAHRLQNAKRQPPPAASKRRRVQQQEESEEDEESASEELSEPEPVKKVKARRGVVLDEDDDE